MPAKKKIDPIKQREKRARIIAAIGGVLLLAVAGYEIPSVMNASKGAAPPASSSVPLTHTTTLPTATPGSSSANSGGAAPAPKNSEGLVDPNAAPPSSATQLVSFSMFDTKDPFRPQVTTTASATASTPTSTTGTSTTPTTTTQLGTVVPPSGGSPTGQTTTTPAGGGTSTTTTTTPSGPTATIAVNGVRSTIAAQGTFPSSAPVFRLVSFTSDSAQISIVGGSYASGDAALTLKLGQPVTLENTTDGKRYTLELVSTH